MGTSDYGSIGNLLILGLANIFQFPFNTVVKSSSDSIYFLGIFVNIAIYSILIYYISRVILKQIKKSS